MAVAQSNKNNSSLQIKWIENTSLCNCHSVLSHPPSTQFGLIKATCTAALKRFVEKWQNYSRFKSGENTQLKTRCCCCSETVHQNKCLFLWGVELHCPSAFATFCRPLRKSKKKSLEDVQSWWGHRLLKRYFRSALKHCFPIYGMNWLNQNHLMLEKKCLFFTSLLILTLFTFVHLFF